jgi:hypothetical protein
MNYFGTSPASDHTLNFNGAQLVAFIYRGLREWSQAEKARAIFILETICYFLVRETLCGFVVALTRGNRQFRAADADLDGVIILAAIDVFGSERERVFIAGLFGDCGIEAFEIPLLPREKSIAARSICVMLQPARFMLEEGVANGNGVDRHVGSKEKLHRLIESVRVVPGIVPVRD